MVTKTELKRRLAAATSCTIQHTGYPCNTCFHNLDLRIPPGEQHRLWLSLLLFRGDYERRIGIDETKEVTTANINKLVLLLG